MARRRMLSTRSTGNDPFPLAYEIAGAANLGQLALHEEQGGAEQDQPQQCYGNTVQVPAKIGYGDTPDLVLPQALIYVTFEEPRQATLMVTCDGPGTYLRITTTVAGRARFTRQFPLRQRLTMTTVMLFGKLIEVEVAAVFNSSPVNVVAALVDGQIEKLGELYATWESFTNDVTGGVLAQKALLVPDGNQPPGAVQSGVFLGCQGFVTGNSGNIWVMFFDTEVAPATGAEPLLAIGPLVSGGTFAFDRSLREDIYFNSGLYAALSTTGDTYTPPLEGPLMRCDFDWGA